LDHEDCGQVASEVDSADDDAEVEALEGKNLAEVELLFVDLVD
jgi:hypothetical protein